MASQNFFDSASEITVALKYIPQFASRPAATGYAAGSLLFDANDNAFYKVVNGAWAVVPFLTTVGSLSDINDVDASGALNNQIIYFDASTSVWRTQAFNTQEAYSSASDLTADLNSVYAELSGATFTGAVSAPSVVVSNNGTIGNTTTPALITLTAGGDVFVDGEIQFNGPGVIGTSGASNAIGISISGTVTAAQDVVVTGDLDVSNITVNNSGTIGSVSDPDAMTITSTGDVAFSQDITIKDSGTIGSATTPGAVRIASDGNVAINPSGTSPSHKLLVQEDGTGSEQLVIKNGTPGSTASPQYSVIDFVGFGNRLRGRIKAQDRAQSNTYSFLELWTGKDNLGVEQIGLRLQDAGISKVSVQGTADFQITDGNLVVADGHGIDFSATAGAGSSELLDDYEEGTWNPSVDGVSTTVFWINDDVTYTLVGDTVNVIFRGRTFDSVTVAAGDIHEFSAFDLPFLPSANSLDPGLGTFAWQKADGSKVATGGVIFDGSLYSIVMTVAAVAGSSPTYDEGYLFFSLTYKV